MLKEQFKVLDVGIQYFHMTKDNKDHNMSFCFKKLYFLLSWNGAKEICETHNFTLPILRDGKDLEQLMLYSHLIFQKMQYGKTDSAPYYHDVFFIGLTSSAKVLQPFT